MTLASPTKKEAIWIACREKTCCYAPVVIPGGHDIWRISRSLLVQPTSFLVYFRTGQPRRDAFHLDHSGREFRLALAKGPTRRTKTAPPCVFLMKTRDGSHRCSLGDLRPAVCRTFPAEVVDGVVCVRPDAGCACRGWNLSDMDLDEEWSDLTERQSDLETYCAIVDKWNSLVADAPSGALFVFEQFCPHVLKEYDAREQSSNAGTASNGLLPPAAAEGSHAQDGR